MQPACSDLLALENSPPAANERKRGRPRPALGRKPGFTTGEAQATSERQRNRNTASACSLCWVSTLSCERSAAHEAHLLGCYVNGRLVIEGGNRLGSLSGQLMVMIDGRSGPIPDGGQKEWEHTGSPAPHCPQVHHQQ